MPLLKPELFEALKETKLLPADAKNIQDSLDLQGLSLDETLDALKDALNSANEHIRLRAVELALKVRGLMSPQEQALQIPQINLIFQGQGSGKAEDLEILLPRELTQPPKLN